MDNPSISGWWLGVPLCEDTFISKRTKSMRRIFDGCHSQILATPCGLEVKVSRSQTQLPQDVSGEFQMCLIYWLPFFSVNSVKFRSTCPWTGHSFFDPSSLLMFLGGFPDVLSMLLYFFWDVLWIFSGSLQECTVGKNRGTGMLYSPSSFN